MSSINDLSQLNNFNFLSEQPLLKKGNFSI